MKQPPDDPITEYDDEQHPIEEDYPRPDPRTSPFDDPEFDPTPPEEPPVHRRLIKANPPLLFNRGNGKPATLSPKPSRYEPYDSFRERVSALPPLYWHIEDLFPSEGIILFHGRPRSMKTLSMMECAYKLASGINPFNSPRFQVHRPAKIIYVTEEDPERLVNARFSWIEKGSSPNVPFPDSLFLMIRKGLSLDDPHDLVDLRTAIDETGAEILFLEPMRSLSGLAEKTSSEFKPVQDWLRLVQRESACKTFALGHHWRKPPKYGRDDTSRSDKVSGGALFSISECLLAFEKQKWNQTLVIPEDYKLSSDPEPFEVAWDSDIVRTSTGSPRFGTWVEASATTKTEQEVADDRDVEKLLKWLVKHPWSTAPDAELGASSRKGGGITTLARLHAEGRLLFATGVEAVKHGRSASAKLYAVPPTTPKVPPG